MKKFRLIGDNITEYEILKETVSLVSFIRDNGVGSTEYKRSTFSNWFDTKPEAVNFFISENEKLIKALKDQVSRREEILKEFKKKYL